MALNDATARVEASLAALGTNITAQLDATTLEIQQLANAVASLPGDTTDIENRLNAVGDQLDALSQQVTTSTQQLGADDPAAPSEPTA